MSADLVILCYHAVSADWPHPAAIDPRSLDRQLRGLLRRGYRPRTLSGAFAPGVEGRSLAVTFDDAFRSVLQRGLPVLRRLDVPATVFVPTDFAAEGATMSWSTLSRWRGTSLESELRCMSWEEVRRLSDAGWEVGSHTCSHPNLVELDGERASCELQRSRAACEEALQRPCPSLAYPFGAHDERVVERARAAGYDRAVTLGTRLLGPRVRDDPLRLSREGVYSGTGSVHFRLATSALLGRLRGWRRSRGFWTV